MGVALSLPPSLSRQVRTCVCTKAGDCHEGGYALKTDFQRRVSFTQEKVINGKKRTCQNTSTPRLKQLLKDRKSKMQH